VNSPVPPESVTTPDKVERSSMTCPNVLLLPGASITRSLSSRHGLQAETQLGANGAAAPALGDEQHDLLLDRGQLGNGHVGDLLFR